jgi:tyrosyl-tRNA synthetase
MAMLLPLLEGTDGVKKMSKTFNNYIGLREPAPDMFGKCMRIPDELIVKYFEYATDLAGADIDTIKASIAGGGNPKDAKLRLAQEVLKQYWGEQAAQHELEQWDKVHSQKQLPTKEEMPSYAVQAGTQLFRILAESGLAASSSEAKRLVKENAVKFEGEVISDPNHIIYDGSTEGGMDLGILQVSRRKFVFLVKG